MSSIQGLNVVIDLSHFNPVTSFQEIKQSGIVGVIHKATEGTNWADPTYASRKPQALAAGLWWGAYHFGINEDGAAQAQVFSVSRKSWTTGFVGSGFRGESQQPDDYRASRTIRH